MSNKKIIITKDIEVKKLIEEYPESVEVLIGYGLNCVNCSFSDIDTLENGLKIHGLDHELEMILRDLNKIVNKEKEKI